MMSLLLLLACVPDPDPPVLRSVSPSWGYRGETTDIFLEGSNFFPNVVVSGVEEDVGRIEGRFEAWLDNGEIFPLDAVELDSYTAVRAEVPIDLEPGLYAIGLRTPAGLTDVLADAFQVTSTRADHLDIRAETASYAVGGYAEVTIQLYDPEGEPVPEPLDVTVTALADDDEIVLRYAESEEWTVSDGALFGDLGQDGTATFGVTAETPGNVNFVVSATSSETPVQSGSLLLTWDAGDLAGLALALPSEPFSVEAGKSFSLGVQLLDAFNNPLDNTTTDVLLYEERGCGTWESQETITGSAAIEITLESACDINRIYAYVNGTVASVTETFSVVAGDVVSYNVSTLAQSIEAGLEPQVALISAVDTYGNVAEDYSANVEVTDSTGSIEGGGGNLICGDFESGRISCFATLTIADPAVQLTVTDDRGVSGVSESFEVVPSSPNYLTVTLESTDVEAGQAFGVVVQLFDLWDNEITLDPATLPILFEDSTGTLLCTEDSPSGAGYRFLCTITQATTATTMTATVQDTTILVATAPFVVHNGPIALVDASLSESPLIAGEPVTLSVTAWDAWNNPYLYQSSGNTLVLADVTGTLSPTLLSLDSDGQGSATISITRATSNDYISFSAGGTALGLIGPFDVQANTATSFNVFTPSWVEVNASALATLYAIDAYGNTDTSYMGTVNLESQTGLCDPTATDVFTDGTATVTYTCTTAGLSDQLNATDLEGRTGTGTVFDVLNFDCDDGPTAALTLNGDTDTVVCLTEGSAEVNLDASGSAAGANGIVIYHFGDSDSNHIRAASVDPTFTYTTEGTRRVDLIAADSEACASATTGYAYIAEDGYPAGPISVTAAATSVANGASTTVTVRATDCTGDVASGETVHLWADLGTASGIPTGSGMELGLNGAGLATTTWSFDAGYETEATLHVGTNTSYGSVSVAVTGDTIRPHVLEVGPSGLTTSDVELIQVRFSEPMLIDNLTTSTVLLNSSTGTVPVESLTLDDDLTTLTVTPEAILDGTSDVFTLTLSANVRDLIGNRLDGGYLGLAGAFSTVFGAVESAPPEITACTPSADRFVPDGDDGAGEEADSVTLSLSSTDVPTWWLLEVRDPAGSLTRSYRYSGSLSTIGWDGRGNDGRIVAAGLWELSVRALDANDNLGTACTTEVELQRLVELP